MPYDASVGWYANPSNAFSFTQNAKHSGRLLWLEGCEFGCEFGCSSNSREQFKKGGQGREVLRRVLFNTILLYEGDKCNHSSKGASWTEFVTSPLKFEDVQPKCDIRTSANKHSSQTPHQHASQPHPFSQFLPPLSLLLKCLFMIFSLLQKNVLRLLHRRLPLLRPVNMVTLPRMQILSFLLPRIIPRAEQSPHDSARIV